MNHEYQYNLNSFLNSSTNIRRNSSTKVVSRAVIENQNSTSENNNYYNTKYQQSKCALTILSPNDSTSSSSFSSPLTSSCSTPSSASGNNVIDLLVDSNRRKIIRLGNDGSDPKVNEGYLSTREYVKSNTSVKDYVQSMVNRESMDEFINNTIEEFEASRSLLYEISPYHQENNFIYSYNELKNDEEYFIKQNNYNKNSCQYVVQKTTLTPTHFQYNHQSAINCFPLSLNFNTKPQKIVAGMKSGITQNSSPTTSSSYETACISNSTSYRIRNEYSANASSNYLEDMYANADLISPSTSYKHNLSSKKHDTYVDEYDNGSMPYDKVISGNTLILPQNSNDFTCAVCGDGHAKLHYGVLACYGCKGFFRRTLTGKYRYACRFGNNCIVDKYQRNSCRYCRFNRCLEVGMDPKAVRPDRDLTGKQRVPRARKRQIDEELISHIIRLQGNDWSRKIPVEAKVLLMQLLNIESKVCKGDAYYNRHHSENNVNNDDNMSVRHLQSKRFDGEQNEKSHLPTAARQSIIVDNCLVTKTISLRELFEQKPSIQCQRTEMCFEPYRMARPDELSRIAYRSALAAVDWIESLSDIGDFSETENKIALIKACYAPLSIFNISARTVQNTKNPDILCLNNHCYVPRKLPFEFSSTTHLSNSLIDRTLNELVSTLRKLDLREEEVVPLKSIIILNPNAKGLSIEAQQHVAELRDRIQDMLFQIVKELHPTMNASARFGNLLLLLPTITTLSGVMNENMQFTQVFGNNSGTEALLNELFEDDTNGNKISMGSPDEPLITSSTSVLTPPLYENPADISLQPLISMRDTLQSDTIEEDVKVDEGTQTELNNFFSIQNEKNLEKGISASFCSPQDLFSNTSKNQIMDETVVDFGPSFDSSSLFDDCELVDSSTFSPEMAAQLFESNDFFEFI